MIMPDPVTHSAAVAGAASGILAFAFDVPAPVVFAAFAGSCFAVAMGPTMSRTAAVWLILGGTIASSYLTPLAHHVFEGYELRGIAALMAFVLIHFRTEILDWAKRSIATLGNLFGGAK